MADADVDHSRRGSAARTRGLLLTSASAEHETTACSTLSHNRRRLLWGDEGASLVVELTRPGPPPVELQDAWLDRDLSWLEFNRRVLQEALDDRNRLLERVKFLAI